MGFQFKQFKVEDSQCAMKVGTDSIILGSWVSTQKHVQKNIESLGPDRPINSTQILDIGTGSGLLALMMAQKFANSDGSNIARIVAIDIEQSAVEQAEQNFSASPWGEFLKALLMPLQTFSPESKFDLIISNPPYFETQQFSAKELQSKNTSSARKAARYQSELSLKDLLNGVERLLAPYGVFYCILPADLEGEVNRALQERELSVQQTLSVQSLPTKPVSRKAFAIGFEKKNLVDERLVIYQSHGVYSQEYRELAKNFYLNF